MLMRTWTRIFRIVLLSVLMQQPRILASDNYDIHDVTTCEEFEHSAYFDPIQVVDSMWKIFYFWSNTTEIRPILFSLPTRKRLIYLKRTVDSLMPGLGVEWHKSSLIMEPRPGIIVLFIYAGTPGAFRALVTQERRTRDRPYPKPDIKFADIRLKLVERYMGMMSCEELTVYALARVDEMPPTERECRSAAMSLGIHTPGGKSYLYIKKQIFNEDL